MNQQLRHFDYMLAVGTLAAGDKQLVSITLDQDSSFILRSRALHIQSDTAGIDGQSDLNNYLDQYTGPDGEYLSQDLVRFSLENPTFGQYGSPLPVRPPMIYPPGGTIQANIQNDGDSDLDGLELYFRGSKLFQPGILPCLTYPDKCSTNRYIYNAPRPDPNRSRVLPTPGISMGVTSKSLNNLIQIQNDADFVCRSITFGSMAAQEGGPDYFQLWIQLRDQDGRAYSNVPVHVDVCYGAFGSMPSAGSINQTAGPTGVYHPPLLTPEIYIPSSRFMLYDLIRDDSFAGAAETISTIRGAFHGAKVYPL